MSKPVTKHDFKKQRAQTHRKKPPKTPKLRPGEKVWDQDGKPHTLAKIRENGTLVFLDGLGADGAAWSPRAARWVGVVR